MIARGSEEGSAGREQPRCSRLNASLQEISSRVTAWTGTTGALLVAVAVVLGWAISGPFFGYSDTWQLVINTGTTVVTFLMVFLIQRAQNKDAMAIQLKLNEIVAALHGADNHLIDVEDLSEDQLKRLHEHYKQLASMVGESAAAASTRRQKALPERAEEPKPER